MTISRGALVASFLLFVVVALTTDDRTRALLANTLLLGAATSLIATPIAAIIALLLARTSVPGRSACVLALVLLGVTPLYLVMGAWQAGFGFAGWQSALTGGAAWLDGWRAAIWIHSIAALPVVTGIIAAGLWFVEPELEELALIDGSQARVLRSVTFRRAAPAGAIAVTWIMVSTAAEMTVTDVYMIRTFAEEIYVQTAIGLDLGEEPLRLAPGAALTAGFVLLATWLAARLTPEEFEAPQRPPLTFSLGRMRPFVTLLLTLLFALLIGVPLASLLWKAGVEVTHDADGYHRAWSLAKAASMVVQSPAAHERYVTLSLVVAVLAATTAVIAGIVLAWIARRGGLRATPAVVACALGWGLPAPVIGLAVIYLLNQPGLPWLVELYDRTIVPLWLAQTIRVLPFPLLILWQAFRTLPRATLESAQLDGAGVIRLLVRVALPQRKAALAVAWLLAFALALGELGASILVAPPGMMTAPIHLFNLLHFGVEDQVASLCLAIWTLYGVLAAAVLLLSRRRKASVGDV